MIIKENYRFYFFATLTKEVFLKGLVFVYGFFIFLKENGFQILEIKC